jgi:hypothetical protein
MCSPLSSIVQLALWKPNPPASERPISTANDSEVSLLDNPKKTISQNKKDGTLHQPY